MGLKQGRQADLRLWVICSCCHSRTSLRGTLTPNLKGGKA